jgi:hypothetical protein
LFDRTPFAWQKAVEWSEREEEFVKRAGFVLMAALAVHDKKSPEARFEQFFPIIFYDTKLVHLAWPAISRSPAVRQTFV